MAGEKTMWLTEYFPDRDNLRLIYVVLPVYAFLPSSAFVVEFRGHWQKLAPNDWKRQPDFFGRPQEILRNFTWIF